MISNDLRNTVQQLVELQQNKRLDEAAFFAGMQRLRDLVEDVRRLEATAIPFPARADLRALPCRNDNVVSLPLFRKGERPHFGDRS